MIEIRTTEREKPPYLLGLLCLIPLLGAFAGIILFLYGLIKYKDKWLMIIGISGVFFTVVIYSFAYYMSKGSFAKQGFATISQHNLNELVKDIEFYKMEYGSYPETLEQLRETDPFIPIIDPLQMEIGKENISYRYEKMGVHYTLFSAGIDGIAYNRDDLHPDIMKNDTTRIGLIRP